MIHASEFPRCRSQNNRMLPFRTSLGILCLCLFAVGCATAPPLAPGITGAYELVSVDGKPLPSENNILDGNLQLRGNRSFTWRFTMLEIKAGGERDQVPVVFEGRFQVEEGVGGDHKLLLTRRDRVAAMNAGQEKIEGVLDGDTLTFTSPDLNAVFRRR